MIGRLPGAQSAVWTWLTGLLLFAFGVLASAELRHRLYANAAVAGLGALWTVAAWRWRQPRPTMTPAATEDSLLLSQAAGLQARSMLDQTPVPLVTTGPDGAIRAANRAARTLFRTDDRIVPPPPALAAALAGVGPGQRTVLELPSPSSSAARRGFALSVADFGGPGGPMRLGVLTDIQAELQAAEAAALREMLQILGHEIMNSLTPVTSLAESAHAILREEGGQGVGRVAEALEVILRRARGLDMFVQGYRTLARLPPPHLRPGSVGALLRDAASLFRARWGPQGVALTLDVPRPDIIAAFDAEQLTQALISLLANAADAVLAGADGPPTVALGGSGPEGRVELVVSDNGPGVQAGQEQAIFRPFFTLKPGGSGIGLAVARHIAAAHGGTLVLQPRGAGPGACFVLAW